MYVKNYDDRVEREENTIDAKNVSPEISYKRNHAVANNSWLLHAARSAAVLLLYTAKADST